MARVEEGYGFAVVCFLIAVGLLSVGVRQADASRIHTAERARDACLSAAEWEYLDCYQSEFRKSTLDVLWPYLLGAAVSTTFAAAYLATRRSKVSEKAGFG
jgi:hypothetical protein